MTSHMIFQEYDCPLTGIDRDLHDDEIVFLGESFHCPLCAHEHTAGVDVQMQTVIGPGGDEPFEDFRPLPKDATERAEWLAEAGVSVTPNVRAQAGLPAMPLPNTETK